MALKPCKECQREVSTSASKCPGCGVANPTTTGGQMLAGVAVLFLLLVGCWALVLEPGGDSGSSSSSSSSAVLDANVTRTSTQIRVTNNSSQAWTRCTVELNAGLVRGGWSQSVARIEPGETVDGGLLAFTGSEGERFNPATHQVERVDVRCQTPSGRASYSGEW